MDYQKANEGNKEQAYMHLTNYAINKLNPEFTSEENHIKINTEIRENSKEKKKEGFSHKRSIIEFFKDLSEIGIPVDHIWRKIKDIVVKTICCIQPILKHNYKTCNQDDPFNQTCFEILGFDILIDDRLKPFLLEVNHSPSFRTDTQIDERVKTPLIRDTFKILNVNKEMKKRLLGMRKKQRETKKTTGRKLKFNEGEYRKTCIEERDEYIMKNKGNFERVYPPETESLSLEIKYNKIMEEAEAMYNRFTTDNLRYKNFGRIMTSSIKKENSFLRTSNANTKNYIKKMKENVNMISHRVTKSHYIYSKKKQDFSKFSSRNEAFEKMKLDLSRRWEKETKQKEVKRGISRRSMISRKSHKRSRSKRSVDFSLKLNLDGFEEYNFKSIFESFHKRDESQE